MNRDTCGTCFAPSDLCKCSVLVALAEDALVCLSETHQQLDAALGYELIGTINGTHGGRWVLTVEDKAAVWPDGTAVYVWRGQE